ncbi:hypothetical protein GCM10009677_01930 [Sphaerisporangium rubeum]|uniref:Uncharacterized protein n=1 Tax=Sphaerisporangium rubeum TaxID=321317 RepID=A0A7X0IDA2_9ACTN|nr:hypothetical protein [Sphaerisporangium rubeum]
MTEPNEAVHPGIEPDVVAHEDESEELPSADWCGIYQSEQ